MLVVALCLAVVSPTPAPTVLTSYAPTTLSPSVFYPPIENITTRIGRVVDELRRHREGYTGLVNSCSFYRACGNNIGFGMPYLLFAPDPVFQNISVSRDVVVFKQPPDRPLSAAMERDVCTTESVMYPQWRTTLDRFEDAILWQYDGFDTGVSGWFPGINWGTVDACPGGYKVDQRPWYFAGRSGQFDMTFVVDRTMGLDQVARARQFVNKMLGSLSFRHYANVIAYDNLPRAAFQLMHAVGLDDLISGHPNGLSGLRVAADALIVPSGISTRPDLRSALRMAISIRDASLASGSSSRCGHYIVLLSGGTSSNRLRELHEMEFNGTQVLGFVLHNRTDGTAPPHMSVAATTCSSGGFVCTNTSDLFDMETRVFDFLAASIVDGRVAVRAAEVYNDYFTGITITTITTPVPGGMLAIDIRAGNLTTGEPTTQDSVNLINNEILSLQTCEPREYIKANVLAAQDGEDVCEELDNLLGEPESESSLEKNRDAYITVSVVAGFLITLVIAILASQNESFGPTAAGVQCCSLIALALMLGLLFDRDRLWTTMVQYDHYKRADGVTDHREINPFRCCETHSCRCEEYYGGSCPTLQASMTETSSPGFLPYGNDSACQSGYHCCREECWQCNCWTTCSRRSARSFSEYNTSNDAIQDSLAQTNETIPGPLAQLGSSSARTCRTHCSTCCRCARSVSNQRCDVRCGTCHRVTIYLFYDDSRGDRHSWTEQKVCSLTRVPGEEVPCINDFSNNFFPIGRTQTIYYNPSNFDDVVYEIDYNDTDMAFCILGGIFLLGCWTFGLFAIFGPHGPMNACVSECCSDCFSCCTGMVVSMGSTCRRRTRKASISNAEPTESYRRVHYNGGGGYRQTAIEPPKARPPPGADNFYI